MNLVYEPRPRIWPTNFVYESWPRIGVTNQDNEYEKQCTSYESGSGLEPRKWILQTTVLDGPTGGPRGYRAGF